MRAGRRQGELSSAESAAPCWWLRTMAVTPPEPDRRAADQFVRTGDPGQEKRAHHHRDRIDGPGVVLSQRSPARH